MKPDKRLRFNYFSFNHFAALEDYVSRTTVDRDADSSSLTEHEPIFRDKRYSASTLSHNIEPRPSIVHFQRRKERKKKKETLERFGSYAQCVQSNARRSMQRVSAQTECKLTTDPRHGDPRCP